MTARPHWRDVQVHNEDLRASSDAPKPEEEEEATKFEETNE